MAAQKFMKKTALKAAVLVPLLSLLLMSVSTTVSAQSAGATLSLNPATVSTSAGQTFTVAIVLDTGGNATDGTRAVLTFDKNILAVNKITPGSIYPEYPANGSVADNTQGRVNILGMDSNATYTGSGTFATVEFTAKSAGTGTIAIDYAPETTSDSNVADSATTTDILRAVTGTTVTVSGSSGSTGGTTDTTKGTLPSTATVDPTLLLTAVGGAFIVFGTGMFIGSARR